MKFTVNKSELLLMLNPIMKVVPEKPALPIISGVMIEITGNEIKATGTNIDNTIICKGKLIESTEDKSFLVEAKLLFEIVSAISEQPLEFEVDGGVTIKHTTGKLSFPEMDKIETFPITESGDKLFEIEIDGSDLIKGAGCVIGFMDENELYTYTCAVCLNLERSEVVVSSTHEIACLPIKGLIGSGNIMIPKKSASILKSLLIPNTIKLSSNGAKAIFESENITLMCTLLDCKYPNYAAIIDASKANNTNVLKIEAAILKAAIKRIEAVSEKNYLGSSILMINLGESLSLKAESDLITSGGNEELSCEYLGESLSLKANVTSLLKHLSCTDGRDVEVKINNFKNPILITAGLFTGITMPVG